jgi:phosphopantothenoylcysteine decarboxylase/phosphopantothenate--cysteine ligase
MGFAIAEELADKGASVVLVAGPVALPCSNPSIMRIDVVSAQEMYSECITYFPDCHGAVMCAAVADFTPVHKTSQKIKRGKENHSIELMPTQDIAAQLGAMKNQGQILVGFALETCNEETNAYEKLIKKNLDFIVLNSLNDPGAGFGTDTNKVSIIGRDNKKLHFELKSKDKVAQDIVDCMINAIEG